MDNEPIGLQDLRRRIYIKAKAEPTWRFWGLYIHICKMETLRAAYEMAKQNKGAPGIDGVTFEAIEAQGLEGFLRQIQDELISRNYWPMRNRRKEIPKGEGQKVRVLGIPSIRDRVVQGALKLILESVFEADFQDGSFGYRPKRTAHQAVNRVAKAIVNGKTYVIDLDLKAYFDTVRHHILMEKVAKRVKDPDVLKLLNRILKASGKKGVPQGGVISPLLANLYLNEVDKMLEKAKGVRPDGYQHLEYARFADDLVVLVDAHPQWDWLRQGVYRRLKEELDRIEVQINEEKTRIVRLKEGGTISYLGFEFRRKRTRLGKWGVRMTPLRKQRTKLIQKLKELIKRHSMAPIKWLINKINPVLRGGSTILESGIAPDALPT
ncbi:MAG: group II intron reverse transcriptase/maturase [Candidatus Obscuribacterales bacterium]